MLRTVGGVILEFERPHVFAALMQSNSTEIVQVPPFAAMVPQVLAVTLTANGGVAAGAVVKEIGVALSLTSVML